MIWLLKDFDLLSVLLRAAALSLEALTLGGLLFLLLVALPCDADFLQLRRIRRVIAQLALALALAQGVATGLSVAILMGGSGFPFSFLVNADFFITGAIEVCAALLLAWLMMSNFKRVWTKSLVALVPAAVVLCASVSQSHGASRLGNRATLMLLTATHHLGTAGWVGGMLFLLLALRTGIGFENAQRLARRYSAMALVSVPLLVLAGIGMSFFYVGSLPGLYGTTYGIMILAKTYLLLAMLLLGAGNYRLLRAGALPGSAPPPSAPGGFLLRLRRFSEAELVLGITAVLAAASLTSQPPAVDLQRDRLSLAEISQRIHWQTPRMTSPSLSSLAAPPSLRTIIVDEQYSAGAQPDAVDRAWSEYNHHWAGLIVLLAALLALAARALPPGRAQKLSQNWPLLFLGLAVFIVLRADPENWPLGPHSFWASFAAPDVLQHRAYALLISCFAFFEWAVATGRRRSPRAAYVFPLLCAAGGAALLTHSHGLSNIKDEMLAEMAHTPIALLGATAGCGRWLQLRLPGTPTARRAGLVWPVCLALAGLVLLDYRES